MLPGMSLIHALYNAPLIRITNPNKANECILGFVDDTAIPGDLPMTELSPPSTETPISVS